MESWQLQFPLRAKGRRLVNQFGQHFKLAGVNWYGASDTYHVVGGLDMRPLAEICHSVAAMGFTVVRLPFSSEMLRVEAVPEGAIDYDLNPTLLGLTPLEVYDRVVEQLGAAGVAVVINNHTTVGSWSGGVELNGMWFREGCKTYTEEAWIDDWVMLAERYRDKGYHQVIGYDLRNEVRPTTMTGPGPRWGERDRGGGKGACCQRGEYVRDWSRAARRCTQALLNADAPGFVVVERIAWPQNSLQDMLLPIPPWEAWDVPRDRIVLAVHMYAWSGPGSWSPKHFLPGILKSFFNAVDYVSGRELYGEMSQEVLEQQMDKDFGFCLDQDICPVWLSELGADLSRGELGWFLKVCKYLEAKDADFAYWPLNVGPKPGGSEDEPYGILTNDWQPRWADLRLQALRKLGHGPLLPLPRRSLPMARRPLQLTPRLRAATFDGFSPSPPAKGSPNLAYPFSPGSVATATPSCYGDVDEVPALAPYPWCAPLPGPLVPWPGTARKPAEVPEARYLWKVLPGFDALPGQDAMSVRCSDAEAAKLLCIQRGFGGFALHQGWAYFRSVAAEELLSCLRSGFDQTVLYIPEEVRLCATWVELEPVSPKAQVPSRPKDDMGGIQDRIVLPLDNDGHPEAAIEACQRACLERGSSGYELGADGSEARLVPQSEEEALRSQWKEGRLRFCSESCPLPRLHLLQLTAVSIGLEVFRDMDAFPGSDARVQKDPGLARCRQICLTEGFAGFAIKDGVARFRSAKGAVLRTRLVPSLGGVFYILTVEKAALPQHLDAALPEENVDESEKVEPLLAKLWSPKVAVTKAGKLQHGYLQACQSVSIEGDIDSI